MFLRVLLVSALSLNVIGCDKDAKSAASLTYTEDAFAAYNEALEAFESEEWEDARALFSELKRLFGYSRYARLAELRLADIDFEQGKFQEAVSGYDAFIDSHGDDSNAEYAKYRKSKALFQEIGDSVILPPQEELDQDNARRAYDVLRHFVKQYPRSRYRVDSRYMLEVVAQRLARHELYVARYYLKQDNFEAAVTRVNYTLSDLQGAGLAAEALVLKGETLLKMKERAKARAVFEQVIAEHGGPFGKIARRFLNDMINNKKAPQPSPQKPRGEKPASAEPTATSTTGAASSPAQH